MLRTFTLEPNKKAPCIINNGHHHQRHHGVVHPAAIAAWLSLPYCLADHHPHHIINGHHPLCLLQCFDTMTTLRDGFTRKNCCSFGFCPNHLSPPPLSQFGPLVQLFSDVKIQDLKVSLELKYYIYYAIYYIYTTYKNSLKFKLLALGGSSPTSFIIIMIILRIPQ